MTADESHVDRARLNATLDRLVRARGLANEREVEAYREALLELNDLVPSSEIAETFDRQLTRKLFFALTDSEFGGHGMTEHLLSISSAIKPVIYMTVLLNDFHEHCRRLPDHIWRLLTMLHNEEYRLAFLEQLEALPDAEQGAILSQVAREFLKVELKNPLMVH